MIQRQLPSEASAYTTIRLQAPSILQPTFETAAIDQEECVTRASDFVVQFRSHPPFRFSRRLDLGALPRP
jgi:hypothetical protein